MRISVVIVTYNSARLIDRCLDPVCFCDPNEVQIVVWDNGSTDGTCQRIRSHYPHVELYEGRDNRGFAAGNNAAFEHCTGDAILLINPDAFLQHFEQVSMLASYLERYRDIAAVGPMLVNADGTHQVGDAGWTHRLAHVVGHFLFLHRISPVFKSIYLTHPSLLAGGPVDVDWLCGACVLVRREVINEVGGLDETIFMYGEDVEWSERMRSRGHRLLYVPSIRVLHLQGGTQKDNAATLFVSRKWIDALSLRLSRQAPRWKFAAFKTTLVLGFFLRMIVYSLFDTFRRGHSFERAKAMYSYTGYSAGLKRM